MRSWLQRHVWHDTRPESEFTSAPLDADQRALNFLVPRKFESLEVWLLLFCGVYGLLLTAFVVGGARNILLACAALLCAAAWRRYRPARNQQQWATGALLAILAAGWILLDPRSGGGAGPFVVLLMMMAMCYPLLMSGPVFTLFMAGMLAVYLAVGWQDVLAVSPAKYILQGLLIAGMGAVSWRFGRVLGQAEQGIDRLRRDVASMAYNEHGLARYGARLLHQCAQQAQPCTLVLLPLPHHWHDALDVSGYGSDYSAKHSLSLQNGALREMALHLTQAMPNDALVSRNASGDWVVLVPGLERLPTLARLEKSFGRPVQLPFGPREQEYFVAITPCAVVSSGSDDSLEKMVARAQDIWLRGVRTGAVDAGYGGS